MPLYMVYCKDAAHADPVVIVAGNNPCNASNHGLHTDIGTLAKPSDDYDAIRDANGDDLFAHLETTYGAEMT